MVRRRNSTSPFSLFSFQDIITSVTGIILLCTLLLALELIDRTEGAPTASVPDRREELKQELAALRQEMEALQQQLGTGSQWLQQLAQVVPGQLERLSAETDQQIDQLQADNAALRRDLASQRIRQAQVEMKTQPKAEEQQELAALETEIAELQEQLDELRRSQRLLFRLSEGGRQAWLVELTEDRFLAALVGRASRPEVFDDALLSRRVAAFTRFAAARDSGSEYFVLFIKPGGLEAYEELHEQLDDLGFAVGIDLIGHEESVIDLESGAAL